MNECSIWASLSDRAAVGESLTAEERLYLRAHTDECSGCAREASLWASLEQVTSQPERLANPPPDCEQPARAAGRSRASRLRFALERRPFLACGSLLAAAAASIAVFAGQSELFAGRPDPSAVATHQVISPPRGGGSAARLALAAGESLVDGHAAAAGDALAPGAVITVKDGQACALVPPGVTVCLDRETEVSVEKLEHGMRRLRLRAGHVVAHLQRQPAGASFGFETRAGAVVAKGTVFSLTAESSTVALRVHEGTVVSRQGPESREYEAPSSVLLSHEQATHVGEEAFPGDAGLLELAKLFSDRSETALVVSAAEGSSVAVADSRLGTAPLSALIRPGVYRMQVSRPGFAPIIERLAFQPGARIVRAYEATPPLAAVVGNTNSRPARAPGMSTPALLLEQARELRSSGRYREATRVYRRLLQEYGPSSEARVALVSLGELQLSQLADASGALRSFEAYLRAGGALKQEASYGRIRALRQLGKAQEARAAAAAFIAAYPHSVQAATLRKELLQ